MFGWLSFDWVISLHPLRDIGITVADLPTFLYGRNWTQSDRHAQSAGHSPPTPPHEEGGEIRSSSAVEQRRRGIIVAVLGLWIQGCQFYPHVGN